MVMKSVAATEEPVATTESQPLGASAGSMCCDMTKEVVEAAVRCGGNVRRLQ